MIGEIKAVLKEALRNARGAAALYLSGGSDSLLLLHILIDTGEPFSIIAFDHSFTRSQRRQLDELILKHDLRVFSYSPSNAYLIGDGRGRLSLVEEYATSTGALMPFIRDVEHDVSRCAVRDVALGPWHEGPGPVGFRLHIFGTRKTDGHYATGKAWDSPDRTVDGLRYFAPLWDWTRRDVAAALKHYGARKPKLDTGVLPMCTNCLGGTGRVFCPRERGIIDSVEWDPRAMTGAFQSKHGFKQTCQPDISGDAR